MFETTRNYNEYVPIQDQTFQELHNENEDEVICKIYGYRSHKTKSFLYHFFGILFLGIPYLIFNSFPRIKTVKYKRTFLHNAAILLVSDNHGDNSFVKLKTEKVKLPNSLHAVNVRYFLYQHTKYCWVPERQLFATIDNLVLPVTVDSYLNDTNGLNESDYTDLLTLYGPNEINVEVKSYWTLFVEEVFNPFYLFQAFSVVLWCLDEYEIYAGCVVVLTLFSGVTSLVQTRKQSEAVHNLVESSKCHEVNILRQSHTSETVIKRVDPVELVPGDLIILPAANYVMPCDAVLITGQCIVNESVLTGESVPVTKTALHSSTEIYNTNTHKRQTLFSGTHIIQTRYYGGEQVLARVVRTGFDTTKGALVKSILFPTPVHLQFYKDSFKFVFVLFTIAAGGMGYCLYLYINRGTEVREVILRTLDIITIVVPPALPAAMAVGIVYSQNRLRKLGIFCISPPRINVCGKIKLACFDKTGTLTLDGLEMNFVIPSIDAKFLDPVTEICAIDVISPLVQGMATCHSLTRIGGELNGDPLDLNMFDFTQWELEEPGEDENARYDMLAPTVVMPGKKCARQILDNSESELPYQIGIVRQFPFSSTLQCMSVICRNLETPNMRAFTKGAPEKIQGMCLQETLPKDFSQRLSQYTAKGYRVIAVAYKDLPKKFKWKEAQKTKRDVIECDMIFLGFLIMQNPLKHETAPVIQTLHRANIRTVMITGDNILTAVSVARDCGMVPIHDQIFIINVENNEDPNATPNLIVERTGAATSAETVALNFGYSHHHFAIDGRTWNKLRYYYPHLIPGLLVRGTIFARFQPDQKTQLITSFQSLDYIVSMVGDGANDCGALKAAHVGVSLSQAEASVAAPFTSKVQDISCIVNLILEGRCAMVTSFATFKYMALYSLIQFFTILILYKNRSILGNFQFLFIDLIITTSLAVTMGRQGPYKKLGAKRPMSSLVSLKNLIPLLLQIVACAFFQLGALFYLYEQKWFKPIPLEAVEEVVVSWENTVVFTVSCYQYVVLATVFSKGRPYREMLVRNFWFLVIAVSLTVFITWMMVYPCKEVAKIMDLVYFEHGHREQQTFRYKLVAFPVAQFLSAVFIEMGLGDRSWFKKFTQCLRCKQQPKNKYKLLLQDRDFLQYILTLEQRN